MDKLSDLKPQQNVLLGYLSGLAAYALLLIASSIGYEVPVYIANGLPYAIGIAMAHAWDIYTGENKKQQNVAVAASLTYSLPAANQKP